MYIYIYIYIHIYVYLMSLSLAFSLSRACPICRVTLATIFPFFPSEPVRERSSSCNYSPVLVQ